MDDSITLSMNPPFPEVISPERFFNESQREQCLHFLMHLAPYSNEILLVKGEFGSGKSTLLRQFVAKGRERWRICSLTANRQFTLMELWRELQQEFGLSFHGLTEHSGKIAALIHHFEMLHKRQQRPILVVDDAHLLNEETADFIEHLMAAVTQPENGFCTILAAEPVITQRRWFKTLERHGLHLSELTPLNFDETTRYIQHHLSVAGLPLQSLVTEEIKKIFQQSQGNMAAINIAARAIVMPDEPQPFPSTLLSAETSEAKPTMSDPDKPRRPIKFSRILLAILTVLLALALYYEDDLNRHFAPPHKPEEAAMEPTT
ncbi:MAG: hypothetical protein FD130_499, partial [Halothiobacillaceae bacterium]